MTQRRLIEETFPRKKAFEDSKHKKNVRHGQFSTLHIWLARPPATCWATIIARLLPNPRNEAKLRLERGVLEMADVKLRKRTLLEAVVAWGRGGPTAAKPEQPALLEILSRDDLRGD